MARASAAPAPGFRGGRARRGPSLQPNLRGGAPPNAADKKKLEEAEAKVKELEAAQAAAAKKLEDSQEQVAQLEQALADAQETTASALRAAAAAKEEAEAAAAAKAAASNESAFAAAAEKGSAGEVALSLRGAVGSPLLRRLKAKQPPAAAHALGSGELLGEWADIVASKAAADEVRYGSLTIDPCNTISKYLSAYYTNEHGKGRVASAYLNGMLHSLLRQWDAHPRLAIFATLCGLNPTTCHTFTATLAELYCLWYRYIVGNGGASYAGEQAELLSSAPGACLVEHKLVMHLVRLPERGAGRGSLVAPSTGEMLYGALEMLLAGYDQETRDAEIGALRESLLGLPNVRDHRTSFRNFVDFDAAVNLLIDWHVRRAETEQRRLADVYRGAGADMGGHLSWNELLDVLPSLRRADVACESGGVLYPANVSELSGLWELLDPEAIDRGEGEHEGESDPQSPEEEGSLYQRFAVGAWLSHLRAE